MKSKIFFAIIAMFLAMPVFAQEKTKDCKDVDKKALQQKMMTMKKATFTKNLKLTKEESERFWPMYEELDKEINTIIEKQHQFMAKYKDKDLLSIDEETANELLEMEIGVEKQIAQLKGEYYKKFQSILPSSKVLKLITEEKTLMRKVMKKNHKQGKCENSEKPVDENCIKMK